MVKLNEQFPPQPHGLLYAKILELAGDGSIVVDSPQQPGHLLVCDFLQSADQVGLVLAEGDLVVVLAAEGSGRGVVLGKVGPYRRPERGTVVLEADEELTVRCGKGSLTIRKNGKILVKGLEIVSHAKGANRIRGGSVQLN